MGDIYTAQKKYALAEKHLLEAMAMYQESLPEVHFYPSRALISLSRLYLHTDQRDVALQNAEKALEIRLQSSRPGSWMIGEATLVKGKCLMALGEINEGKILVQESLAILEEALPKDHKLSVEARRLLANIAS